MTDRIERSVELKAPIARVWRAVTDHKEFGTWFRVKLEGPFAPGKVSRGHITYPGYENLKWESTVVRMDEPHVFSFNWHPYAVDPNTDYSKETPTLVEFRLETTASGGTRVTVTESGFDKIPLARREEALRSNTGGWEEQMRNIKAHVDA